MLINMFRYTSVATMTALMCKHNLTPCQYFEYFVTVWVLFVNENVTPGFS